MYLPRIFQIASESPEAVVKICFRQIPKPLSRHRAQSLSVRSPPLSQALKCQPGRVCSQCCSDGCHVDGPQDKGHRELGAQHKQWPGTHSLLRPTVAHASSVLIKVIPFSVVFIFFECIEKYQVSRKERAKDWDLKKRGWRPGLATHNVGRFSHVHL